MLRPENDKNPLEGRLRHTLHAKAGEFDILTSESIPTPHVKSHHEVSTALATPGRRLNWVAVPLVGIVILAVVGLTVLRSDSGSHSSVSSRVSSPESYTMTASDERVLPGQTIILTVDGPDLARLSGGGDAYFEKRVGDGWRRLYKLVWYGQGDPTVQRLDATTLFLPVQATPFPVLIPAVPPGAYRITRLFDVGSSDRKTRASTRVTVKKCPLGQRPTFVEAAAVSGPNAQDVLTPLCV